MACTANFVSVSSCYYSRIRNRDNKQFPRARDSLAAARGTGGPAARPGRPARPPPAREPTRPTACRPAMPRARSAVRTESCGSTASRAAATPMPRPATSSMACSSKTSPASRRSPKTGCAQEGQLAAAFEHAAQLTAASPNVPNSKPQPAQALERGEIGVLHGEKLGQPLAWSGSATSP